MTDKRIVVIPDVQDHFWERVNRGDPDACWEWRGARNAHRGGYGHLRWAGFGGQTAQAHRVAYALANPEADLKSSDFICHSCDNPPCCNPAHLWRGSHVANVKDMFAKGRGKAGKDNWPGELSPAAKLTADQVNYVRSSYGFRGKGGKSLGALAKELSVSVGCVHNIVSGRTWAAA